MTTYNNELQEEIKNLKKESNNEWFKTTLTVPWKLMEEYTMLKKMGVVASWGDCATAGVYMHKEILNLPLWLKKYDKSQEDTTRVLRLFTNRLESMQISINDLCYKIKKLEKINGIENDNP